MKWADKVAKRKMTVIFCCFALFLFSIIIRLFYIQVWRHDHYEKLAKENWDREIPFTEQRGHIVDRNGEVIVGNEFAPTLYFMRARNNNIEAAAQQVAKILDVDEQALFEKMSKPAYLTRLAPEGKNISQEQANKLQQMSIPGLFIVTDYKRHYPHSTLLARLVGFTGYDNQGLAGIEYQYNEALTSSQAALRLYTDAKGKALPNMETEFKPGRQGATVQLTIDLQIQQIVENKLALAMHEYEAQQALAIVAKPKTGEILALASHPTYFPGNYQKVPSTIYNQNLPVFMTYEPGSTFKIITLAAALEEKLINLHDEHFYDHGYTLVEDARLRCWKREGHKDQTFLQVVENSCNPGFVEMGRRLGNDRLLDYIKAFGFGESTGANIAGEATGILFRPENFGPVEAATTAFGQGVSVTPLQQIQAVSAAINGGHVFQPFIVQSIIDGNSQQTLNETKPSIKRTVISEETSSQIREALESVVANGSGRQAYRDGLRVGGKTGTAQKVVDGRYKDGQYIVSFIGFAPANDPEIIVYVAVDSPVAHLQFGSVIAAPIVGEIIEEVSMSTSYLEKQKGALERKFVWGDPVTVRVANYVGLTKEEVLALQETLPIKWHGTGSKIVAQLPKADSLVEESATLHLYLHN